jgi:outer membrane protein insertion porin family
MVCGREEELKQMRLSPILVTVVAIAAPLSNSLSVKAQTPKNLSSLQQTTEIVIPTTNQEHQVVGVFPASPSARRAKQEVTVSTSRVSTTAQSLGQTPVTPTIEQPSIPGAETQQQPQPTPTQPIIPPPNTQGVPEFEQPIPPGVEPQQQQPTPTQPIIPPPNTQGVPEFEQPIPPGVEPQQQQPTPTQPIIPPPSTQPAPEFEPNNNQPGIPENNQPDQAPPEATEPRVLVSEVAVTAETGQLPQELEDQVYKVIRTSPGRTTTRSQLQEDINAIFATGFFSNVQAVPEDTPLGVRVSFVVQPNPILTDVNIQANPGTNVPSVISPNVVDEIFKEQYGRILNLRDLQEGIKQLTNRYQEQGYVLAQVIGAPQVSEKGVVTLQVAEGVVEDIRVQFRNKEGQETDEKGQPIRGRTQPYIITRELELDEGDVFNRNTIQQDLQRVFGLGLFEDVNVSLDPGTDPSQVDVVVNVVERNSGSIGAGAGLSSASGLFGTVSYQEQNLNGRNQRLGAEVQVGQRELLFDVRFTDPWIAGDPNRTSYTANLFRRRSISLIFDGDDEEIETFDPDDPDDDGDRPRVLRLGGGVTFTRPLSGNPYERSEWVASAGLQYQRVSIRDADGDIRALGRLEDTNITDIDLSASDDGTDDLVLLQLGASRDRRNNPLQPTSGSFLRVGIDQSVPIGSGSIFLTRLRGSYSQYVPVNFTNFSQGAETLAFNIQAGTILGDLPPYEAFSLGGSTSVRGYDDGDLGTGRSFVQATAEYRFPVFSVVSGALFFDVGSDLGSSIRIADLLDKPGTGFSYGVGVRVQSPLGPIRIDYGINDEGDSRINFGIGERF